jgi:hypothetical protein
MADQSSTRSPDSEATTNVRTPLTSFILIVLAAIVGIGCVIVLAATLIQTRVSAGLDGGSVGIRKLHFVGLKWVAEQSQYEKRTHELQTRSGRVDELIARSTLADSRKKLAHNNTEALLVEFHFQTAEVDKEFGDRIRGKGHDVQVSSISADRDKLLAKNGNLKGLIESIEKAWKDYRASEEQAIKAAAELNATQKAIKDIRNQVDQAKTELDDLINLIKPGLAIDKDARARVENAFYELNIVAANCERGTPECGLLARWVGTGFYTLLTLRPDLLTLFLVLLMGILGSALQISHAYFMRNQPQSIGGYFQRISVGAMAALVIFIVAKAGVPVVTDPSRLSGDAPINPYFVSFLAIISGLLSENAIANIQAQGARFFGTATEINRWARRDLTSDLAGRDLSIRDLARYLGEDETKVEKMIKGEEKISPADQNIIALALRSSPRDLFTDIPPS